VGAKLAREKAARAGAGVKTASRPPFLKCHQTWSLGARTGGTRRQQGQVSEAKTGRGGGRGEAGDYEDKEGEEEDEAEGDGDRDAAPHGPRCMDPPDPATRRPEALVRRRRNY